VSHTDPELVEAVRRGRAEEFGLDPGNAVDPQAETTFLSAKLDWDARGLEPNAALLRWYRSLLQLRSERPALAHLDPTRCTTEVFEDARALLVRRDVPGDAVALVLAFDDEPHEIELMLTGGPWSVLLDSHADERAPLAGLGGDHATVAKLPARSALVLGNASA
jgi:maltooligosyltrehalose trehalohydrolase